jgi:ABC-type uncharacterized transport system substrate-binding protein
LLVVDSYSRDYLWSQNTRQGLCAALLQHGYLESQEQVEALIARDEVESAASVVQIAWMDTKRKSSEPEMVAAAARVTELAKTFQPDLLLLGDDNAAHYLGNQFLDTELPIVFWGVNNTPVKYGLVDNAERPGHNVTGVYQTGYYAEGLELLKTLAPGITTFAVLADASETARAFAKNIEALSQQGALPLALVETVSTNDFAVLKQKALDLQGRVDAFFVAPWASLKGDQGQYVPPEEVAAWYLESITIPEATGNVQYVQYGLLCAADDSGYKQAFEAVRMAHDILANGADPATLRPLTPTRGSLVVNRRRARQLGLTLTPEMGIEEYVGDEP